MKKLGKEAGERLTLNPEMGTTDFTDSTDKETRTRILTFSHPVSGFVRPDARMPLHPRHP